MNPQSPNGQPVGVPPEQPVDQPLPQVISPQQPPAGLAANPLKSQDIRPAGQSFAPVQPQQPNNFNSSVDPSLQFANNQAQAPASGTAQPSPFSPAPPVGGHNSEKGGLPWVWIVPLAIFVLLTIGISVVAYMNFQQKEDYKNNSDQKAAAAVEIAKNETEKVKEAEFLEREKSPYKVYKSPATFGSVSVTYPKSWSAAVDETQVNSKPVDGYFHPGFVPGKTAGIAFAMRLEVVDQSYERLLQQYEGPAKQGKVKISAFKAPKVPAVLGSRIDGEIARGLNGSMILLPIRDKTIKLSTESQSFIKDFNNIILPNFVFTQ